MLLCRYKRLCMGWPKACPVMGTLSRRAWVTWVVVAFFATHGETSVSIGTYVQPGSSVIPHDLIDFTVVDLALDKAWRIVAGEATRPGRSADKVKDHLTKGQLDRHFPTPATELGPVYTWRARMYGRDVTYPMHPNVTVAAFAVLKAVVERLEGGVVKLGTGPPFRHPFPVDEERVNIGLQELLTSLPGPASTRCSAKYSEATFRTTDVWLDVWFKQDSQLTILTAMEPEWQQKIKKWMHLAMAELGFPQIYFLLLQNKQLHMRSLAILRQGNFINSSSFRFTLMLQGNCLIPVDLEKQSALQSVLEHLMAAAGDVYIVRFERVSALVQPSTPSCFVLVNGP
eukprot:jgi/Botrbrau1/9737/Bobra.0388s0026.1